MKEVTIGVDLHKTQFTVFVREGKGEYCQYMTDEAGYEQFFKSIEKWKQAGRMVRVGVESTGNTRYFKNRLEREGVEVKVINTLKFKVVNESVKKTDRHDASTIAEFLEKDMLPEARLCTEKSEELRRLLKVRTTLIRTIVSVKNQIHGLLTGMGMEDARGSLQSKRGRQAVLNALSVTETGLAVHPLFETIDVLEKQVKKIEEELERLAEGDRAVELLQTVPGCGRITAWTIRAFTDDIGRFSDPKKYASYAGLAPWVQCSNKTSWYGRITKRGPEGLRTALVQLVMGMNRSRSTQQYRIMVQYKAMKKVKGSGKSIIATARKLSTIIWFMLTHQVEFNSAMMTDKSLYDKAETMRSAAKQTA